MTMSFSSANLLSQLDQPKIIDWALELKNGREAYAFLLNAIRGGKLNSNQTLNGLHSLFRIRHQGTNSEVLHLFVEMSQHHDLKIRSEAVQLAVGLVSFVNKMEQDPLILSDEEDRALRRAVQLGVTPKVKRIAHAFLKK